MAANLSKARQETAVGEGLAIGCRALGFTAVTSNKMAVEFAFVRAWRDWRYASTFRVVHATHARNDLLRILHASSNRRGVIVADWSCGRYYEPRLRGDWDVEECASLVERGTDVPLDGWIDLARAFTGYFKPEEVRRNQ